MKGLILSGGKGTRLRPLTFTQAKQLVPVANKPVLFYGIEALRDAGITEIGIIVGDTKDEIREACGDGGRWGVRITYIEQPEPLGLAHAVLTAKDFLGRDTFVMYLGDNILKSGITSLVEKFEANKPNALILLTPVPDPEDVRRGRAAGDGRVARLVEKPKEPKSNLALVGVYMFDEHIFEAAGAIKPSGRGELEITDAIQYLVDHGFEVQPHLVSGWWKDTGKIEDILEANRLILEGMAGRIDGTVDAASRIKRQRRHRGRGACAEQHHPGTGDRRRGDGDRGLVRRAVHVDPAAVPDRADGDRAQHRPRGERDRGRRGRIDESLIGREVRIYKCPPKPSAYRFMVGDKSEIGIK